MQKLDNGGQVPSRPAATATNDPGYANNDPTRSTAPTIMDPDWVNAITDEVGNVLDAAGITMSKTAVNQLLQATTILFGPTGECYLGYVNANSIVLLPKNGNRIKSGGVVYLLPAAGVSAANIGVRVNGNAGQSLAGNTVYFVSFNGAEGTLNFWAQAGAAHGPDSTAGNIGVEVITGSGSPLTAETLVGLVYTNSSGQFQAQGVGTSSWFNPQDILLEYASVGPWTVSSYPSPAELTTAARLTFAAFAGRAVNISAICQVTNNTANAASYIVLGIDGTPFSSQNMGQTPPLPTNAMGASTFLSTTLADGNHYSAVYGGVNVTATTGTFGPMTHSLTVKG